MRGERGASLKGARMWAESVVCSHPCFKARFFLHISNSTLDILNLRVRGLSVIKLLPNPVSPKINLHILLTVLHVLFMVLVRRIYLSVRHFVFSYSFTFNDL